LVTNLDARAISVLRAYTRYFKQLGFAFSQSYIEATLNKNAAIAQDIVELFMTRFDPAFAGDRAAAQQHSEAANRHALGNVASLDEDRILRQFVATVMATLRTNLWQTSATGAPSPT
jgi:glutamate dehydrogenase